MVICLSLHKKLSRVTARGHRAYIKEPMWDMKTVRNTRQGRSIKSIQAQVDRALGSTAGTNAYYKNYRRLMAIAQRYTQNIQNEMDRRAANNPNAMGNSMLSRYQRDYTREKYAMVGSGTYQGGGSNSGSNGSKRAKTAAMGGSVG